MDRAANLVWYWATRNADEKGLEQFRIRLWQPPANAPAPKTGPWSAEEETQAFRSLKASVKK